MRASSCATALMVAACLVGSAICFAGCGKDSSKSSSRSSQPRQDASPSDAVTRITASQAIESAGKMLQKPQWQLAFLSNTGADQPGGTITGQDMSPDQGLMLSDGRAGQWVLGFIMNSSSPPVVSEVDPQSGTEKKAFSYRLKRFRVTAKGASQVPEIELLVPMDEPRPRPIEDRFLDALDSARQLAIGQVRTPYHVMSVVSRVSPEGECSWFFKFYDLKKGEIASKVRVSGDGARVLEWI